MARKRARDEAADGEDGAKAKGGPSKVKIILAGLGVLAIVGGGAFFFLSKGKDEAAAIAQKDGGDGKGGPKKPTAFVDLPEMTINLAVAAQERQQFLKLKIALEVSEQKVATDMQPMLPRVMDTFQVFMRELRPSDLEGSAGLYRLKEEMVRRVNVAVYPAKVDAVLFKEMLVQ